MVEDYRRALWKHAVRNGSSDDEAIRQIRILTASLQKVLLQVIPESVRRRLATTGEVGERQLAAIEIRLLDSELERYPWELIAHPAALQSRTAGITVWRRVLSPPDLIHRSWTNNLLLTGKVSPFRLGPGIDDELSWIKSELSGCGNVHTYVRPDICSDFRHLLAEHPPTAFHFVAHETDSSSFSGTDDVPIHTLLHTSPMLAAAELSRVGAWLAVFSYSDSASVQFTDGRPTAYQIAERSGASVIGMAGPTEPYSGGLFSTTLYRCLANGSSAVHAYYEAMCRVRNYRPDSDIWSIPVMYARTSNVIPFPSSDEAKIRLGLVQIRLHVEALDRELEGLTQRNFQDSGEWASRTATSIVRTERIKDYLAAATTREVGTTDRRRQRVSQAQDELEAALSVTRIALDKLGDPTLDAAGRRQALRELPVHRTRQQRILRTLDELIEEVG
jgi:hypothetical protein